MIWGIFIGMAAFMALSGVLGGRLLFLARRSRGVPELAMGVAFLVAGVVGTGLGALARVPRVAPPGGIAALTAAGKLCIQVGAVCQAVFTWRVFHPHRAWARAAVATVVVALAVVTAGGVRAGRFGDPLDVGLWRSLEVGVQALAIGWGALESLRYWLLMRRRMALGLADALVTDRFLLWAVAIGAGVVALVISTALAGLHQEAGEAPMLYGLSASIGLVSAVGYWLTFFPPRWYRSWVAQRATRSV